MRRKRKSSASFIWLLLAAYVSSVLVAVLLSELLVRWLRGVSLMEVFFGP